MSASLSISADKKEEVTTETANEVNAVESNTATNLVRESADGGSTQSLALAANLTDNCNHPEGSSSEKEKENAYHDLDKDIDVMIEANVEEGFINPDGSTTLSGIQIDETEDSVLNGNDEGEPARANLDSNGNLKTIDDTGIDKIANDQPDVLEKSFTSSTDSSVVAEAVVKKVIDNALTEFKSDQNADEVSNNNRTDSVVKADKKVGLFQYGGYDDNVESFDADSAINQNADQVINGNENKSSVNTDKKVGLFQYGGFDEKIEVAEDEAEEEGDETEAAKEAVNVTTKVKDLKVGLFQYSESVESEETESPKILELDDNEDTNEEEKDNILKLYGLEGLDAMSPKSASPPESGPVSVEDYNVVTVIDVQRDVYEPQTRMFSVTKSSSSTESTPRNEETKLEESEKVITAASNEQPPDLQERDLNDSRNGNALTPPNSEESDGKDDLKLTGAESGAFGAQEISPPLVRYEPVTDNGKFRIVKTVKEGGPISYSTIRVGTSPSQSPRETGSQESQRSSQTCSSSSASQRKIEKDVEYKPKDKRMPADISEPHPSITDRNIEEINKDIIRELIEQEQLSSMVPTRDSGASVKTHAEHTKLQSVKVDMKSADFDNESHKQLTLNELRKSPQERIKDKVSQPSPREAILGGEVDLNKQHYADDGSMNDIRQGRQSYENNRSEDSRSFERRYQSLLEHDTYYPKTYNRERYVTEEPSRDNSGISSWHPAPHKDTQYEIPPQRSMEPAIHQPIKPLDSGVIPGFKTLQEQQAKWSAMFRQIEDEHRHELRSQYDKHQANIKRLQQQMEHELQKQHLAIRKKLDLHKEALSKMSPDRLSPSRRYRSPDRSTSPMDQRERSSQDQEIAAVADLSELQSSQNSKSWREIYREVRAEESDLDAEPSPRLQRALDSEFAMADTTVERSRPAGSRPSPRGRSKERDISKDQSTEPFRDSFPSSYEEKLSRSSERESRSKFKGSRSDSPDKEEGKLLDMSVGSNRAQHEEVSPYVQELLDNLKDSQKSLRGLQDDMVTRPMKTMANAERTHEPVVDKPRAGVYSSPMPGFKGKVSKASDKRGEEGASSLPSVRGSRWSGELQLHRDTELERRKSVDWERPDRDVSKDSFRIEDILSSSERVNLREKHSKHLADLRAYYEEELRELRKALSDSMELTVPSADTSMQATIQYQLLEAENQHLLDKCKTMEDELEELYLKIRTIEQKNHGLEKRASEYAGAFSDSQAMAVQHRAHIEELQRYCRERDDLVNDLESKVRSQEDGVKLFKKSLDEEMELHRQDKISLQRITDRYESLDREYKLMQETMTTTENKLYEARTEIVELNRTMSKLELENKRLGRENDNLRHKVTQSLNLSTMHDSFGSPSSPRGEITTQAVNVRRETKVQNQTTYAESQTHASDDRIPMFADTNTSWNSMEKSKSINKVKAERGKVGESSRKINVNNAETKAKKETKEATGSAAQVASIRKVTGSRSSNERDVGKETRWLDRSRPTHSEEQAPVRDQTPPRPASANSQVESEISDYSPLLKAERELFKLRDMMRQAVAVKPSSSPPPPKLQKKFYGSERPSSKESYTPDLGPSRGRKEQPSNHTIVAKTKTGTPHSKSERMSDKSGKKSSIVRSDRNSVKIKDRLSDREKDRKEKSKEEDQLNNHTPPRKKPMSSVNPEIYDSPTRFDINVNEDRKTVKVSQRKGDNQSVKQRNLQDSYGDKPSDREEPVGAAASHTDHPHGQETGDKVTSTLDMMRNGQFTARPQWEDVFTSMVKPKPETQEKVKAMTREEKVKERLRTISEMESRYDGLQIEKRQLESSINKIPLHGRVDRNSRKQKELLEDRLDSVEKELGSLRMSLKRYNVLKTAG